MVFEVCLQGNVLFCYISRRFVVTHTVTKASPYQSLYPACPAVFYQPAVIESELGPLLFPAVRKRALISWNIGILATGINTSDSDGIQARDRGLEREESGMAGVSALRKYRIWTYQTIPGKTMNIGSRK